MSGQPEEPNKPVEPESILPIDEHVEEMITLFQVNGAMIYVDPDGNTVGYDDVFTRIDKCRAHYAGNGLGSSFIDQFIR